MFQVPLPYVLLDSKRNVMTLSEGNLYDKSKVPSTEIHLLVEQQIRWCSQRTNKLPNQQETQGEGKPLNLRRGMRRIKAPTEIPLYGCQLIISNIYIILWVSRVTCYFTSIKTLF